MWWVLPPMPDPVSLGQHQEAEHGTPCNECGKFFKSQTTYNQHKRMHGGIYRYRCPLCLKGCSSTEQLRGHMGNKHGRTEFLVPCPVCGRQFTRRSKMTEHIRKFHPSDVNLIGRGKKESMRESLEPLLANLEKEQAEERALNQSLQDQIARKMAEEKALQKTLEDEIALQTADDTDEQKPPAPLQQQELLPPAVLPTAVLPPAALPTADDKAELEPLQQQQLPPGSPALGPPQDEMIQQVAQRICNNNNTSNLQEF